MALMNFRVALIATIGLAIAVGSVQAAPSFKVAAFNPPDRGAPGTTAGGASRSRCLVSEKSQPFVPLTLLVPSDKVGKFGLITTGHPTVLVYVPKSRAQEGEFVLRDMSDKSVRSGKNIYRMRVALAKDTSDPQAIASSPGVYRFSLPATAPTLEPNKEYQWFFSLICDPNDRLEDVFASAWIVRSQPAAKLTDALKQATPRDRSSLYAASSYWYDAVATLAELRQATPRDPKLKDEWTQLLNAGGLGNIADQPIVSLPERSSFRVPGVPSRRSPGGPRD